jgi:hypothetical protein
MKLDEPLLFKGRGYGRVFELATCFQAGIDTRPQLAKCHAHAQARACSCEHTSVSLRLS